MSANPSHCGHTQDRVPLDRMSAYHLHMYMEHLEPGLARVNWPRGPHSLYLEEARRVEALHHSTCQAGRGTVPPRKRLRKRRRRAEFFSQE